MWNCENIKNWRTWISKRILKRGSGECSGMPACGEAESDLRPDEAQEYTPAPGQRGKTVEWVPASPVVIARMFDAAKVTPEDYVIDLGSGDGRMVISAARLGARAMGIEYNPKMVELSMKNAAREGVSDRATFIQGDLFEADLSGATVLSLFLREDINMALRPRILNMRPGARVVSNIFHMREWKADEVMEVEDENYYFRNHTIYFWVVPARVGGAWKLPDGELMLEQSFQMISGSLRSGGVTAPVSGRMTGDLISFSADGIQYTGRVTGSLMEINSNDGSGAGWKAILVET